MACIYALQVLLLVPKWMSGVRSWQRAPTRAETSLNIISSVDGVGTIMLIVAVLAQS